MCCSCLFFWNDLTPLIVGLGLLVLYRWSMVYFVLWWLVSSVIWINLFLALLLEVPAYPVQARDCLLSCLWSFGG